MKKVLSMILALALVLSLFAGCGDATEENTGDTTQEATNDASADTSADDSKATEEAAPEEVDSTLISEEPMELTIFEFMVSPFKDDYAVFQEIADITNVSLKGAITQSASEASEAFNLMVATGELADIVAWDRATINDLALEGAFIQLDDLIDEHAPNLKAFLEANPDVYRHAKNADGNIYMIPYIPDGAAAAGWFMRQDWLDIVGLEQPTTIDELHTVLKAFREEDPNGNGEKDEMPYFTRSGPKGALKDLTFLFGGVDDWYAEDGKVFYGPAQPEYGTALEKLATWYAEGLIDQEIFTRGKTARDYALKENMGGMTHDWFGSTAGYNDSVEYEGFAFLPIAPPANPDGEILERTKRNRLHKNGWAISANNENPVETIKYFDFLFTEEGRRLMNFGVEGVTYDMVDGAPVFKDEILTAEGGVVKTLHEYGCQLWLGYQQDFEYEKQWMNPIAKEGVVEYIENDYFADQWPAGLPYTVEERERLSELMVAVDTLKMESIQKWVLGAEEVSVGFEPFVQAIEDFGIQEATDIQQAAYDRYLAQ